MSTQILQKEEACRAPPEKFWSKVRINERISKRWWKSLLLPFQKFAYSQRVRVPKRLSVKVRINERISKRWWESLLLPSQKFAYSQCRRGMKASVATKGRFISPRGVRLAALKVPKRLTGHRWFQCQAPLAPLYNYIFAGWQFFCCLRFRICLDFIVV